MNEVTDSLVTIREFCRQRTWPTEAGLRWLIFNSQENGFGKCVVRIGRRVLIDEKAFFKWTEAHREAS